MSVCVNDGNYFTNASSSILGFVKDVCSINKSMHSSDAAVIMNEDYELNDFKLSDDEFSGDETSRSDFASYSGDDAQIRFPGLWGPAGRSASNAFLGQQGPSSACNPTTLRIPSIIFS